MAAKGEYRGLIHRNNADLQAWLAKRPPEAALEPELPIIDPHHHLWDTPVRGHYFLPELLADIGAKKRRRSFLVERVSPPDADAYALFLASAPSYHAVT